MTRVCWICQNFVFPYASGEIRMFFNHLSRISGEDLEIHVITNTPALPGRPLDGNFVIHPVQASAEVDPLGFRSALRFFLQSGQRFRALQRTTPFDVLQMVSSFPALALYLGSLARSGRARALWGFIGFPLRPGQQPAIRYRPGWYRLFTSRTAFSLLGRRWSHRLDGIVVASSLARDVLTDAGVAPHKIFLVPPAVDLEEFLPWPARRHAPPRIIYLSSCYPWKGVFDLLEAYHLVRQGGVPAELEFVFPRVPSEVPYISQLERRVATLGLTGQVRIRAGLVHDTPSAIGASSILACPLRDAAQTLDIPMSLLEGMACGLPVVATRVGAIPEVVVDGGNGYVVAPGAPTQLATALRRLLQNPGSMERMGVESLRRAAAFDVRRIAPELRAVYTAVAGARRIGRGR